MSFPLPSLQNVPITFNAVSTVWEYADLLFLEVKSICQ